MEMEINCNNYYRCWECANNCFTKQLFMLNDLQFMAVLHDSFSQNIGFMMAHGLSMPDAERLQKIKFMSLITARMKFLESKH